MNLIYLFNFLSLQKCLFGSLRAHAASAIAALIIHFNEFDVLFDSAHLCEFICLILDNT